MNTNKSSAVAEMGDRLTIIDVGRKLRGCAPFGGELGPHLTQSRPVAQRDSKQTATRRQFSSSDAMAITSDNLSLVVVSYTMGGVLMGTGNSRC